MNYSIGVPQKSGYGLQTYDISREGNSISIMPPDDGRRGGQGYALQLSQDKVEIRGASTYDVEMTPEGVVVSDPKARGMRGGAIMTMQAALDPKQYQAAGLAVASSLLGIPISLEMLNA
jgi:hypothetical protein